MKKLRFKEIRIEPYEAVQEKGSADPIAESCGYRFAEKGGANILNGRHELLPEGALNICLVIHSIPENCRLVRSVLHSDSSLEQR